MYVLHLDNLPSPFLAGRATCRPSAAALFLPADMLALCVGDVSAAGEVLDVLVDPHLPGAWR
jgi:hypothetical protein